MIVFDLACAAAGHVFEAWFGSTEDYESQRARGLVECPLCGDRDVQKAMMAPRVAAKSNQRTPAAPRPTTMAPAAMPAPAAPPGPEKMKALLGALAEAQRRIVANSDYVGRRFAEEARAIHHGETEQRTIHGVATPAETRALIDDGIEVAPLPFPVRPPRTDN